MATHSRVLAWRIPGTGAWWAAVHGVAQSRTRLKQLSSSSSNLFSLPYFEGNTRLHLFHKSRKKKLFLTTVIYGSMKSNALPRASLIVQWLWIHLAVQGTPVGPLVQEDPTSQGATKTMHHNLCSRVQVLQILKLVHLQPILCYKKCHCSEKTTSSPRSPNYKKPVCSNRDALQPKIKL